MQNYMVVGGRVVLMADGNKITDYGAGVKLGRENYIKVNPVKRLIFGH